MKLRRTKIEPWEKKHLEIIGGIKMGKTVKARFSKGVIKPLEKVDIEEGKEITITIMEAPSKHKLDAFKKSAGAWKGTIDAEKLIENIYANRLLSTREEPRL
jgi:predicted DNA-binding antitoxin AbrB/MazE fold protein